MDVAIRPFADGDEVAVNDAFNEVFSLRRPLEEWLWKFPPAPGGRTIMTAWDGDRLVAHYAGMPVRYQVDGRVWTAAQIGDVFSRPSARRDFTRRGVWVRTVEEFFATFGYGGRLAMLFGFPSPRPLKLGVLQLGYDAMPPQPITSLACDRAVPRTAASLLYRAEMARDWEPRLDQLWQRARASYPVTVVRDAEWALRRFAGRPAARYHRFLVFPRLSERPVAWAAFRTDLGCCHWVDLVWDHDHPGALALLARMAGRLAAPTERRTAELWLNGDLDGRTVLERLGFVCRPEPRELMMVARSFPPEFPIAAMAGRVYLTLADADLE